MVENRRIRRPRRVRLTVAGLQAMCVLVALVPVGPAFGRPRPAARVPVERPRFTLVGVADWVWGGSSLALVGQTSSSGAESAVVLPDTGRRIRLSRQGCDPVQPNGDEPLSLPYVIFTCEGTQNATTALFSTSTGRWLSLPTPGGSCGPFNTCQSEPVAAGTVWLEYDDSNCPMGEHCSDSTMLDNIATGASGGGPLNDRQVVDLDAASSARTVCRPLTVPAAAQLYGPPLPGSLTFYGAFAVAVGNGLGEPSYAALERCGTRLHRSLGTADTQGPPATGNRHVVLSVPSAGDVLDGLTLPRLRAFWVDLPPAVTAHGNATTLQFALTARRLYVLDLFNDELWSAPSPTGSGCAACGVDGERPS